MSSSDQGLEIQTFGKVLFNAITNNIIINVIIRFRNSYSPKHSRSDLQLKKNFERTGS